MTANGGVDRILRDVNGSISDHLQNHIHLTNCIHLKNHLHHKQSPFLRDLVALQKSRHLRDPSETTRSLRSQRRERDDVLLGSRRFENRCGGEECTRISGADDDRRRTKSSRNILENGVSKRSNAVSERFELREKGLNMKGGHKQEEDDDDAALSCNRRGRRQANVEKMGEEEAANTNRHGRTRKKEKRRRFRSARRDDASKTNSFDQNRCANIPWNWSRIHHRGRSFLDAAGRSLSRSLSKKEDATISHHFASIHDYSGELCIFADDSDLPSQGQRQQHQNLTQKYMPTTFNDLVGQNLVVQALSNAVIKRKIGLLYVFYGPHGTGKTACARIFARALNCQSAGTPKPCGFCDSCVANENGWSRNVKVIDPVGHINYKGVLQLFENRSFANSHYGYGVFIFDECDAMSSECWSALLKVVYGAPRRVVIILVCSSLDALPHVIVSRCQKFCFTKLRDAEIVRALRVVASREDLDIDGDALELIASRSGGSLRDAEMTLEQLSLLGQKIELCLVQELIGLISDEKLVDLLDFALSADTVNTVRNLREIMASGVEPLALMSQLAAVITDILAGSYDSARKRPKMKFFHHQSLSKEEMEKLRRALKTLSEAEKQLRVSGERMTWLTAALLQLAPPPPSPHQRCTAPASSADSDHSPILIDSALRVRSTKGNGQMLTSYNNAEDDRARRMSKVEEIWLQVLENIKIKSLKEFMHKEGKMVSISYGAAPTVQLVFNSQLTKSVVEKFRSRILQAFEAVLGSPVTVEIGQESRDETGAEPILLRGLELSETDESERESSKCNGSVSAGKKFGDERELSERNHSLSIVRQKVSLAHVIKHQHGGLMSKREAVSIADELEQENLKLESRSRRLLCWNPPRTTHPKISCLKIRRRKPHSIRKFVCCGRCLCARSPKSQVITNILD